jgi:hypothetical protein
MIENGQLLNYIGGKWKRSCASEFLDVRNPATAEHRPILLSEIQL